MAAGVGWGLRGAQAGSHLLNCLLLYKSDKGEFSRIHSAIQFQFQFQFRMHFSIRLFVLQLNRETLFFTFLFLLFVRVESLAHFGTRWQTHKC